MKLLKPFPGLYVEAQDIGRAMLQATRENIQDGLVANPEIRALAARYSI